MRDPGEASAARSRSFLERARLEAERYGPDPWVFVRELLQNARDAGARVVSFAVEEHDGVSRISCFDDGEGMTFEHARRYLFSLYASSKEGDQRQAGRFGVGFWSVLRFDPSTITIRSRPRAGAPWGITLAGSLERGAHATPPLQTGTEIVLERAGTDGQLERRVYDAVRQNARYLQTRDAPRGKLRIIINGRTANAPFDLPAPSSSFERGAVRGVVGLGPAPRVELFSRGLRVRAAACLEDLLSPTGRHTDRSRVHFPELPGGLAPQAVLESDKLELMLSRADARDDRHLRRLVRLAQRELERLVDRQLSQARPEPFYRRLYELIANALQRSLLWRTVLASVAGATTAVALGLWLWGLPTAESGPTANFTQPPVAGVAGAPSSLPYADLGARYRGPQVDVLGPHAGHMPSVDLRYRPEDVPVQFAALVFERLAADGSPENEPIGNALGRYTGIACEGDCVEVELSILAGPGAMRLPVPTGHRVDPRSVTLTNEPIRVGATPNGGAAIVLDRERAGVLRYATAPAPDPLAPPVLAVNPALSRDLSRRARALRQRPVGERVSRLLALVRNRVVYDRSQAIADEHDRQRESGAGFIERTLAIGAGDCDVQNALLVALLQAADVPSRLAVGYLGYEGRVWPWLHAWAEYRGDDGVWRAADASVSEDGAVPGPDAAGIDEPPDPIAVAPTPAGEGEDPPEVGPPSPQPSEDGGPAIVAEADAPDETPAAGEPIPAAPAPSPAPPESKRSALSSWANQLPTEWIFAPLALVLAALALLVFATRTRRSFALDQSGDLSRLLQGALQQPEAFRHLPALFHRRLVPLGGGDAISLERARELSATGRLYRSKSRSRMAERAIRKGASVLDCGTAEARTVADALGAIDLDRWDRLLEHSRSTSLIETVNRALRDEGEDWVVRLASGVVGGTASLDLVPVGARIRGLRGRRVVLVDEDRRWLRDAQALFDRMPHGATFMVLDHLVDRVDLPAQRRARVLAAAARFAIEEAGQ